MEQGKNQTFSREINLKLTLQLLRERSYSGTELATTLHLSHATASSIIKELEKVGIIRQEMSTSLFGYGRKRVNYELNPHYGLILGINISNFHANISLLDITQKVLVSSELLIARYDKDAIYDLILSSSKLVMDNNKDNIPLKCIVITLPGMVNKADGDLIISKQFDKELFSEKHYIQNAFHKIFSSVPIILENDNNVMTLGEKSNGELKDVKNGVYFNIDYGIGGSFIINNELYSGESGFAGEFGLIPYYDGISFNPIDELVSLRALKEEAKKILNREVERDELFLLYQNDSRIKDIVLQSAKIVGYSIRQIANILDIHKFVISGRVTNFGDEYLSILKEETSDMVNHLNVVFSKIGKDAEIFGTASLAIESIIKDITKKDNE